MKKTQENSTTEKIFALILPILHLFFFFVVCEIYPVMTQHMVTPRAFSAHRSACGCEMDILASVQPHIHAALKIAACVLISLLFVIQVQLLFLWRRRGSKQQHLFKWAGRANGTAQTFGTCVLFALLFVFLTKRASGAKVERVAVKTAERRPAFSRLSCHVCY